MMKKDISRMPETKSAIEQLSPMGRMAKSEEVAEVVYFLCTPGASYVSGTALEVDAALSLTRGLG
jgi:NAD(P)-dependent dehydrogenase (short-subunit alcohol dehydrogenase family)